MDMERIDLPKILVIHQGALGDVVLSFPALSALRQERGVALALLCNNQIGRIAKELRVVDAHFPVESARFCGLFSEDMGHDMVDFINQYESIIFVGFSDCVESHLRKNHKGQTCKITPRPQEREETHVGIHMMKQLVANSLLKESNDIAFHTNCPTKQTKNLQKQNLFLVHPGAGSKRKRWDIDDFIEVADAIREMNLVEVVFLIGPAETDLLPTIRNRVRGRFRVCQIEHLSKVTALIKASGCFIGNDSGLAHLASFMGIPTVAIFGPSNPNRWSPMGRAVRVLRGAAPGCSPCFEVAETNCKDPQCLEGVSVEMVVDAVRELYLA